VLSRGRRARRPGRAVGPAASNLRPLATLNLSSDTADGLSHADLALLHRLAAPLVDALVDERLGLDRLGPVA
jgi:hypothetical protein